MNYSDDERAIIRLDCIMGLSREQKLRIIAGAGQPASIWEDIGKIREKIGNSIPPSAYNYLEAAKIEGIDKTIADALNKSGITAVTFMSDKYPERLTEIEDPPLVLYCKGNIDLLSRDKIFTIVGSRKTLPNVLALAEEFSAELSKNGVTIVTGLAEGVDAAAIKGALPSGNIISVLPGGFRHVYPNFHRELFEKISEKGLAVSEYPPDVVSKPYFFPERNRILAAMSEGVLVCSAGKKSGTNYTADYANNYGKDVFAFPYSPGVPSGEGCNAMIKEFAYLCDSTDDIFFSLGIDKNKAEKKAELSDAESKVYECIREGEIHIDALLIKTEMKISAITPVLTMLEIKKYIVKNPGNTYSAIK